MAAKRHPVPEIPEITIQDMIILESPPIPETENQNPFPSEPLPETPQPDATVSAFPELDGKRSEPKSGVPSADEFQEFFSRIVIRYLSEWYVAFQFRGIDEESLSDREIERLLPTDMERNAIARPFAELSNKTKFMRKHGRVILASADSFEAVAAIGMWASRVNRIARKHRPARNLRRRQNVNSRPDTPEEQSVNGHRFTEYPSTSSG